MEYSDDDELSFDENDNSSNEDIMSNNIFNRKIY